MSIDYSRIGEYACDKANDYERSLHVFSELLQDEEEINKKIRKAEMNNDKKELNELYKKYRENKQDQKANSLFREKFCNDFMFEIKEMAREIQK